MRSRVANFPRASATIECQPSSFAPLHIASAVSTAPYTKSARRRAVPLGEHLRPVGELEQPVAPAPDQLVELRNRFLQPVTDALARLEDEHLRPDAVPLHGGEEDPALLRLA